jgi:hypothetical protein
VRLLVTPRASGSSDLSAEGKTPPSAIRSDSGNFPN